MQHKQLFLDSLNNHSLMDPINVEGDEHASECEKDGNEPFIVECNNKLIQQMLM